MVVAKTTLMDSSTDQVNLSLRHSSLAPMPEVAITAPTTILTCTTNVDQGSPGVPSTAPEPTRNPERDDGGSAQLKMTLPPHEPLGGSVTEDVTGSAFNATR